jgi:hypothetical protein
VAIFYRKTESLFDCSSSTTIPCAFFTDSQRARKNLGRSPDRVFDCRIARHQTKVRRYCKEPWRHFILLNDKSRSLLSNTARGRVSFENAESLFLALESAATDSSVNGPKKNSMYLDKKLPPRSSEALFCQKIPSAPLWDAYRPLSRGSLSCARLAPQWSGFFRRQNTNLPSQRILIVCRVQGLFSRFQMLQPPRRCTIRVGLQAGPILPHPCPDRSVIPSQAEQSVHLEDESAKLAQPSHRRLPTSGRARQHSEKPALVRSGSRPIFWRELVDFKVRLISLLRRRARPGNRHH